MTALPASTAPAHREALVAAIEVWRASFGSQLVSLVLFGSVARGTARGDSDIDLLVIADGFPRSLRDRRRSLLADWDRARAERRLAAVAWNLVTKTPDEARTHSPLYLDIVEDGICLFDRDGFFASVLETMRTRMRALGSRRVMLDDGSWYWDLKPDFQFGDVVEI